MLLVGPSSAALASSSRSRLTGLSRSRPFPRPFFTTSIRPASSSAPNATSDPPACTPASPPSPREGPAEDVDLAPSSDASKLPAYPSFASISSTHQAPTAPAFLDPTLPPIPHNTPKYQPLRSTLPLTAVDVYLAPTLDPEIQPPPHLPPAHPFWSLSLRDQYVHNKYRNNPLLPFPRPIVVPLYPTPVLQPTDPRPASQDPTTIKYQALEPEQLASLYEARIARRPRRDRQHYNWLNKMMDDWDREPDDPEGWQGVRMKMGLPPHAANRPPSLLWQWEALEEEQLLKFTMPLFYLTWSIPIVGGAAMLTYEVVFNDRWTDVETGEFKFVGI